MITLAGSGLSSNVYLLLEDKPTLIDTGLGRGLLDEIAKHIPPEEIELVINTHCHFDHIGGNALLPDAEVIMHELAAKAVTGGRQDIVLNVLFKGELDKRVDRTVSEGDFIDLGSAKLRVLHTPGHTAGSICLLLEEKLFTGDTLFSGSYGRVDLPTGNEGDMRRSLEKLVSVSYSTAFPGHGRSFGKAGADSLVSTLLSTEFQ